MECEQEIENMPSLSDAVSNFAENEKQMLKTAIENMDHRMNAILGASTESMSDLVEGKSTSQHS